MLARLLRILIATLHFSLSIPSPRALLKFITPLARCQSSLAQVLASFSPTKIAAKEKPELGISEVMLARSLRTLIAALHFLASMPSPRASSKSFIALAITGRDSANLSSCFSPKNPPARLASPDNSSAPVRISIASAKFLIAFVVSGPNV